MPFPLNTVVFMTVNTMCLAAYQAEKINEDQDSVRSSFKIEQVYDDFPIPAYGEPSPVVRDYTDEERAAAWEDRDRLRVWEDHKMYLIPVEPSEIADERQLLLLADMMAGLPDGVWRRKTRNASREFLWRIW